MWMLTEMFGDRVISSGSEIPYPPRTPDLIPVEFLVGLFEPEGLSVIINARYYYL